MTWIVLAGGDRHWLAQRQAATTQAIRWAQSPWYAQAPRHACGKWLGDSQLPQDCTHTRPYPEILKFRNALSHSPPPLHHMFPNKAGPQRAQHSTNGDEHGIT